MQPGDPKPVASSDPGRATRNVPGFFSHPESTSESQTAMQGRCDQGAALPHGSLRCALLRSNTSLPASTGYIARELATSESNWDESLDIGWAADGVLFIGSTPRPATNRQSQFGRRTRPEGVTSEARNQPGRQAPKARCRRHRPTAAQRAMTMRSTPLAARQVARKRSRTSRASASPCRLSAENACTVARSPSSFLTSSTAFAT